MDLVPDPKMLHVDLPTPRGFIAEDSVSTCPLLTPSPPTNALVDPTSEPQEPSYIIPSGDLVAKLKQVEGTIKENIIIYFFFISMPKILAEFSYLLKTILFIIISYS